MIWSAEHQTPDLADPGGVKWRGTCLQGRAGCGHVVDQQERVIAWQAGRRVWHELERSGDIAQAFAKGQVNLWWGYALTTYQIFQVWYLQVSGTDAGEQGRLIIAALLLAQAMKREGQNAVRAQAVMLKGCGQQPPQRFCQALLTVVFERMNGLAQRPLIQVDVAQTVERDAMVAASRAISPLNRERCPAMRTQRRRERLHTLPAG